MPDLFSMEFLWPPVLWALLIMPLLVWIYTRRLRGRPARGLSRWLQWSLHGPFALIVTGLMLLILAIARPQAVVLTPMREAAVMLAMDTSGSMRADDVKPSRIDAARAQAGRFVLAKPARLRVGLVTIAGTAALAQAPTDQRDDLLKALEHLPLQYGSALGSGILISLEALLPGSGIDAQKIINEASDGPARKREQGQRLPSPAQTPASGTAVDGRSKAIVLLTDGQGNLGPELLEMARLAAQHRVRIYTVGVGTKEGAVVQVQGRSMRVRLEEDALQEVARITSGEYFRAGSAEELHQVYDRLGTRLRFEKRGVTEVSGFVALLGMLLALMGSMISLYRFGRIV
jgi:Ca-activated chloride channel family protein